MTQGVHNWIHQLTTEAFSYAHVTGDGLLVTGPGILGRVVINNGGSGSMTLRDGLTAGGTVIAIIDGANANPLDFHVFFSAGLYIQSDITDCTVTFLATP